jgi:DNA topoisomerase-1
MVQIGTVDEEEKPQFASLLPEQSISSITFEEAMALFELPRKLGVFEGEEVEANVGRYGPYVRWGKKFISLDKGESAFDVDFGRAQELIEAKKKADAPIAHYDGYEVTKGVGRFGPFIKWNGLFVNVNKKYDFDNLSQADIEELIEAKKKKEAEKLVQEWSEEGIRIEKSRWGRHNIIKGKTKIELSKDVDAASLSLDEVKALIEEKAPKKKKSSAKGKTKTKAKK